MDEDKMAEKLLGLLSEYCPRIGCADWVAKNCIEETDGVISVCVGNLGFGVDCGVPIELKGIVTKKHPGYRVWYMHAGPRAYTGDPEEAAPEQITALETLSLQEVLAAIGEMWASYVAEWVCEMDEEYGQ
jgi:hypothetical protein